MAELVGPGANLCAGATSNVFTTPFPHALGDKARDREGNEYLFVDCTSTVYYGTLVQINSLNQATPLLGTANVPYRVGVVVAGTSSSDNHPTSNNGMWVQIYGIHPAVQTGVATGEGVSATAGGLYYCIPQTSVGTPSGTLSVIAQGAGTSIAQSSVDGNQIYGMWVVDLGEVSSLTTYPGSSGASGPCSAEPGNATSGAATSAYIGQCYAVFLNYPYVTGLVVPFSAATSDV